MLGGSYTLVLLINCVHNWRIKNLVVVCINNYPFFSPYIIHVHICTLRKEDRPLIIVGCEVGGGPLRIIFFYLHVHGNIVQYLQINL